MNWGKSKRLFSAALKVIPGGVNSPVRAFKAVGGDPLFIARAKGSKIYDVDGNEYVDYVLSWGPMIAGHSHPSVLRALESAIKKGTSFGAPTPLEVELAQRVIAVYPSIEKIRMVNSGTEATMSAIRVARGYTGRDKIIKFEGCYHGHADGLLVKAGSGAMTFGVPDSPGVPKSYAQNTLTLPFNDINKFRDLIKKEGKSIACVILEPVVGNIGCVLPKPGFLETIRKETRKYGIVLIFDEVMTGFRVAYGGAQALYGIRPDLSCFGKIIGGGLPVGAYGGRRKIMSHIAPQGPVYQAGTLSGNPLAMAAGIATLKQLQKKGFYEKLEKKSSRLCTGLAQAATQADIPVYVDHVGSMLGMFFCAGPVRSFEDAKQSDLGRFTRFYQGMRREGIYIAPSQFEALFLSAAHTDEHIDATVQAAEIVFRSLRQ